MRNLILAELQLGATDWANVSAYRYDRAPVVISRGRGSTETQAGPAECSFTLDNTGGLFSPRNPNSPLYGKLGRNTPVRISIARGLYGMVLNGTTGRAEAGDTPATSIAGDIDIRVDLELLPDVDTPDTWTGPGFDLASKWEFVVNRLNWSFIKLTGGKLQFAWYPTGTTPRVKAESGIALDDSVSRRSLRVTLDVDNAGQNTVTFYRGDSLNGPWTVLGAPVTQAGVTSIFNGDAPIRIGSATFTTPETWGRSAKAVVYGAQVRAGINGTVVASPDFTAQPLDPVPLAPSNFTDAQGNNWTFNGTADAARIWYGDVDVRFVGELASLPPRWDESHSDKYIPVVAAGSLRRYNQGQSPVAVGLRDFVLARPQALTTYFPLNGGEDTQYSLNLGATYTLGTRFYGVNVPGQNAVFTYGKDMGAAWLGDGMEINATGSAYMRGDVGTGDPNVAFDFVFQAVPPGLGVLTVQLQDYNVNTWNLTFKNETNDPTLQVSFDDPTVGPIGFLISDELAALSDTGKLHHCRFQIFTVGADTQFKVYIDGELVSSGTMAGYTVNGCSLFRLFYTRYVGQTVMNIAHLTVWAEASAANIPAIADCFAAAFGYAGETAGERIERVCADGNIPIRIVGDPADTPAMGVQFAETRLAQIRDAEATDFGILTEQRDANGLLYRTRTSMYAQDPVLTLDYSAKVVAPPFEPVDDDDATRNDVTATRRDGGSFQLTQTTGPLAALEPPAGIGIYEDEVTVNVETDAQLEGVAAWLLNIGTLDEARFPSVTVNLQAAEVDDALAAQVVAADVGDLVLITDISAADIPDDLNLILAGYTETITNKTWVWTGNATPATPFQVPRYGEARYDADGSVLTAGINTTALTFQATKTGTSLLTTDPAAFPCDINVGGERMTVSNITGATSPQTVTLSARSVNGVVKSHAANEPIRLWDTPRYAL
ncbi:MAG TPA: hypothetical protein VIQ30_18830 [Pseudonocardia sp.]